MFQSLVWPCLQPCCEPSVFSLVKSSLDCRLDSDTADLLDSVLLLAGCCGRVFLYHLKVTFSVDVHAFLCCWAHWCVIVFLTMYQTVDLATLTVPAISLLMDLFCSWSLTIVCFTCMERFLWLHDVGSEQQLKAAVCNFFWLKIIWNHIWAST